MKCYRCGSRSCHKYERLGGKDLCIHCHHLLVYNYDLVVATGGIRRASGELGDSSDGLERRDGKTDEIDRETYDDDDHA